MKPFEDISNEWICLCKGEKSMGKGENTGCH